MKPITEIISLVAAIIALITAVISYRQGRTNSEELKVQKAEIARLQKATADVALAFTIDAPKEGDVITTGVYNDMHGSYTGDLPPGYKLWVLARDPFNYFLMYPPTQFTRTMRTWSQTNVRLGSPGRWQLHVCLANEAASQWLEAKARKNDWSGFPSLPEGMETVRYVTVERR